MLNGGLEDLAAVQAFAEALCTGAGVVPEVRFAMKLAAEEAYANIITHGYGPEAASRTVELQAYATEHEIAVGLVDHGTPFDPQAAPPVDVESGWKERPIGGVGWHLIRRLTDRIEYDPSTASGNQLMLVKRRR